MKIKETSTSSFFTAYFTRRELLHVRIAVGAAVPLAATVDERKTLEGVRDAADAALYPGQ